MRIAPVTNKYFISNHSAVQNHAVNIPLGLNERKFYEIYKTPAPYFISFNGYKEDKRLIENMNRMLDTSIDNVRDELNNRFTDGFDNKFLASISLIEQEAPDLYVKITKDPEVFCKTQEAFEKFNKLTLESMDEVKYDKKRYSSYWEQHSKTGKDLTANIIREVVNASPQAGITKIIKNSDFETYEKIKNHLIKTWFAYTAEEFSKKQPVLPVAENMKKLAELIGKEEATDFKTREETYLRNTFNRKTNSVIPDTSASEERKLNAFKLILDYVEKKLLEDKGLILEKDLNIIYNAKKNLEFAEDKESLLYANPAIKMLHKLAFEKWEKDNFKKELNTKLEKEIYIKKGEKEIEELKYLQNYPNFDIDSKYFVVRYYKLVKVFNGTDNLSNIINDRHNRQTAANTVNIIKSRLDENRNLYFTQLDDFYDLLWAKNNGFDVILPERQVQKPDDKLSFADLYLKKLGILDRFKRYTEEGKLKYLSGITRDEMTLLNESIKQDWYMKDEKYAILNEVGKQAKSVSVLLGMYDELKKINLNLDEIKIKTNEAAISLKEVLENKSVLSAAVNERTNAKLSAQAAELERQYNNASLEEKQAIDKNMSEAVQKLTEILGKNSGDTELNNQLAKLAVNSKGKNSTLKTLGFVKNMLITRGIFSGMDYSKQSLKKHIVNGHLPFEKVPFETVSDPAGAVDAAVTGGTSILSHAGAFCIDPVTVAIAAAVLIAGSAAIIGHNQASKLERNQRQLIFNIEI